jgi:outer membrane receptor for ferrienterochelin and colicins
MMPKPIFLFSISMLFGLQLTAQSTPDTTVVPLQRTLDQVVITGQFTPTDSRSTVNAVRTIDQQTIRNRAIVNLEEILATEANLRVSQDGVFGSGLKINGLQGENVKVLVDGVPVMGRLNGSIDLGQLPLQNIKQIEMIEGAQSLMYGSGASGGVINLITQKTQEYQAETTVSTNMQTAGFRTVKAQVGTKLGKWFSQASVEALSFEPAADTLRNQSWNPKQQENASASLRYAHNDAFDLRLSGTIFQEKVDNLGEVKRPQYKPYAFDDIYDTKRNDVILHMEGWLKKKKYFWQLTSGMNDFKRIRNSYRYDMETDTLALLEGQQDTSRAKGVIQRGTFATDFMRSKVNVLIGAEHFVEFAEGARFIDTTAERSGKASNSDLGVFSSVKWRPLTELTVQGGARLTVNENYGSVLSPSVWMLYHIAPRIRLRASYANGFRTPGIKELYFQFIDVNHFIVGNRELLPERSHNFRADLNVTPRSNASFDLSFNLSGFYNQIKDRIILTEFAPVTYTYQNIAKWRTMGTGLSLNAQMMQRLTFKSSAVYTGFYNQIDDALTVADDLSWSVDWSNELTYRLLKDRFSVQLWHKYTGVTPYFYVQDGNTVESRTAAYSMLNGSVSTQAWGDRLRINLGAKNLLNKRTVETRISDGIHSNASQLLPIHWGRMYFVSLSLQLHSKS